ncbi:MAG TPA: hypothetical protein VM658_14760, partial [bacterium]|nr:hypothetical protein [bacterium]
LANPLTGAPRKIKLPGGRLENLIKTSPLAFLASWRFSCAFILDSTEIKYFFSVNSVPRCENPSCHHPLVYWSNNARPYQG